MSAGRVSPLAWAWEHAPGSGSYHASSVLEAQGSPKSRFRVRVGGERAASRCHLLGPQVMSHRSYMGTCLRSTVVASKASGHLSH